MNTDVLWPEREWAESQVLRIQTKLHQWAIDDPDRRFDDLFNLVCDPAVLVVAWARVRGNKGKRSAGVDGLRPDAIFSAEEGFLPRLRDDLKARQFTPLPVRERMIPKPGSSALMAHLQMQGGSRGSSRPPTTAYRFSQHKLPSAGRQRMLELSEPLITASARKHGVADDDMLHAFNHPISYEDLDEGLVMTIGPTRSAHLIELGFVDTDHGPVIVHAMTARRKYLR